MLGDHEGDRAIDFYNGDRPIVTREPEHDMGPDWAWRYAPERCDEDCYHPMHAFGGSRGIGHLAWFRPGTPALIALGTQPSEQEHGV